MKGSASLTWCKGLGFQSCFLTSDGTAALSTEPCSVDNLCCPSCYGLHAQLLNAVASGLHPGRRGTAGESFSLFSAPFMHLKTGEVLIRGGKDPIDEIQFDLCVLPC